MKKAVATNLLMARDGSTICSSTPAEPVDLQIVGTASPSAQESVSGSVFFCGRGLAAIYAFPGVKTPEGIGLGSTYAELIAVYHVWEHVSVPGSPHDGRGGISTPGNSKAHYRVVVSHDKVVELSLDANDQSCYE